MEEKHRITEELNLIISLKMLATAYEEIAVIKMRFARDSVLHNRDFLSSLSEVFKNVKSSYKKRLLSMQKKNQSHNVLHFSTHQTNGRAIFILLSANNKLYGEIVPKVFHAFIEKAKTSDVDIAIVGKLGKELFEASRINKPYMYFEIPDVEKNIEDLKPLVNHILQYETVTLFHGKFLNIISQEAVATNITGEESLPTEEGGIKQYGFIFEPSMEVVLSFFESQIFTSFLQQAIHEAELARFGSRISVMEKALEYIIAKSEKLTMMEKQLKYRIANTKQLERLAGISLWTK